jgi:hypothetical protein
MAAARHGELHCLAEARGRQRADNAGQLWRLKLAREVIGAREAGYRDPVRAEVGRDLGGRERGRIWLESLSHRSAIEALGGENMIASPVLVRSQSTAQSSRSSTE